MRKFLSLILALCLVFSFAAFAQEPADEPITFEGPYVVTSAGQSADYKMVSTMLKMNKVENYTEEALLSPDNIPADVKTIIIVIGGSSKGLGAAGIDADQELARIEKLIAYAQEKEIVILAMHIGGMARRGDLSDKFIEPVVAVSKACLVVEDANTSDQLFDTLSEEYEVPMTYFAKKSDGAKVLAEILK
jgi:hypothetical protein